MLLIFILTMQLKSIKIALASVKTKVIAEGI